MSLFIDDPTPTSGAPTQAPPDAAGRAGALLGIAPDGMGIDELPEADVECCGGACPCRGEPV